MSILVLDEKEEELFKMHKPIEYVIDLSGCYICTSHARDKDGYPRIQINGKKMSVSRYVYEQAYGKIPHGLVIMHAVCDNPSCIKPEHLRAATHKENMEDRNNKLRQARGENNGRAKLTEVNIIDIRKSMLSSYKLAKIYGVNPKTVRDARKGVNWKYISNIDNEECGGHINTSVKVVHIGYYVQQKINTQHNKYNSHQFQYVKQLQYCWRYYYTA